MKEHKTRISCFEHQSLKVGSTYGGVFTEKHRLALERFHEQDDSFYDLVHKGVRFKQFVGVLQVGKLSIEVLPKADKVNRDNEDTYWRDVLVGMLQTVGAFDIKAPSKAALSLKHNFVLDLYFSLFLKELEYLLHKGLIKRYRKKETNSTTLKGALQFGKHLQKNLVHQERFYVKQTTYDQQHHIHQLLYKALVLLKRINTNNTLNSRIGALLLNFPEQSDTVVSEASFNSIAFNRKNQDYKQALEIARLLLLNYHPDLSNGQNHVLALLFNMNSLWEKFVYTCLRKHSPAGVTVSEQSTKPFWQPNTGRSSSIRPDIVVRQGDTTIVLDTKWKNIQQKNPSSDDLRQLYVYHEYFAAKKVALVYPGDESTVHGGVYYDKTTKQLSDKTCSVITIKSSRLLSDWQAGIVEQIFSWAGLGAENNLPV